MLQVMTREMLGELIKSNPEVFQVFTAVLLLAGAIQYFLGPKQDWVEGPRERILIKAHEFLSLIGAYGIGEASPYEFAYRTKVAPDEVKQLSQGRKEKPGDVLEREFYQMGFHRNLLACKKYRIIDGGKEWSEGSWVKRDGLLADRQLHIFQFYSGTDDEGNHLFDVYGHTEHSNIKTPIKHFVGSGSEYKSAHKKIRRLLDEDGIDYEVIDPPTK